MPQRKPSKPVPVDDPEVSISAPDSTESLPEKVMLSDRKMLTASLEFSNPLVATSHDSTASLPTSSSDAQQSGLIVVGDSVKGGSLDELTRILFDPAPGVNINQYEVAYRLTYASFTNPTGLLHVLRAYYENPEQITAQSTSGQTAAVVRLRVCNFLQKWIQDAYRELTATHLKEIEEFSERVKSESPTVATKILQSLKKSAVAYRNLDVSPIFSDPPPMPIIPTKARFGILDVAPPEFARQLTLLEHALYRKISAVECLNKGWTLKDKESRSPNVLAMIHFFNRVSSWVTTQIVTQPDLKLRVQTIEHFITIGDTLRGMHNFNAVNEIVSGIGATSVRRLSKTWEKVAQEKAAAYAGLQELMNPQKNYANYRDAISKVLQPITPFVGTYLTDMVFIDEGNSDFLPDHPTFINFSKRQRYAAVIQQMMHYKQEPYNFLAIPMIQQFIENVQFLSEEERYQQSLKIEPKATTT